MPKKWTVLLFFVVCCCCCSVSTTHADTYTRGKSDHPLRYVAYIFHPVGIAVEYLALRPIHKFVSRDPQATIFGHQPQESDAFPGWAGRKRFDDTKARTPLYTFMSEEPGVEEKTPIQMMKEEMEAEACCCGAREAAPECEAPVEAAPEASAPAAAAPREGVKTTRIQVEVAESA